MIVKTEGYTTSTNLTNEQRTHGTYYWTNNDQVFDHILASNWQFSSNPKSKGANCHRKDLPTASLQFPALSYGKQEKKTLEQILACVSAPSQQGAAYCQYSKPWFEGKILYDFWTKIWINNTWLWLHADLMHHTIIMSRIN